ncbi:unnamed protein product, partial [Meganyctiphanes norvegica]
MSPLGMYDTYQPWVLQTYGDSAKTKTITRNKYQRILQILRGDYIDNETSKFKLWCKGRGFRIGPPPGYIPLPLTEPANDAHMHITALTAPIVPPNTPITVEYNADKDPHPDIYVQTGTVKDSEGKDRICYKKVAVVEDFFDIIYNLHVCKDGKDKKHMGQKRTYRAVSERYAFVPREAVTKFLVLCTECPRRSSAAQLGLNTVPLNVSKSITGSHEIRAQASPKKEVEGLKLGIPVPLSASQQQTLDLAYQQQQSGVSQSSSSSPPTSQPPLFTHINSHIPSATYLPQSNAPSMVTNLATPASISITKPPHTLTPSST